MQREIDPMGQKKAEIHAIYVLWASGFTWALAGE